jgi:hypothetical protein
VQTLIVTGCCVHTSRYNIHTKESPNFTLFNYTLPDLYYTPHFRVPIQTSLGDVDGFLFSIIIDFLEVESLGYVIHDL